MRKYKFLLYAVVFFLASLHVRAIGFDSLSYKQQEKLIESLSEAVCNCDIAVMQKRVDEPFRNESKLQAQYLSTLGIKPVRFIRGLKGTFHLSPKDLMYIYESDPAHHYVRYDNFVRSGEGSRVIPQILNDDSVWIVFLQSRKEPKIDLIEIRAERYVSEMELFVLNSKELDNKEFIKKYNLIDTFNNCVYEVFKDCAFLVQYPALNWEFTDSMEMNRGILDSMIQGAEEKRQRAKEASISLTKEEASEIVFIAFLVECVNGLNCYEELSKTVPILQNSINTEIARRLLRVLTDKGGGNRSEYQL